MGPATENTGVIIVQNPQSAQDALRGALDALYQLRHVLEGQRDAWCNELEEQITSALDLLDLRKPHDLTDGQELMARCDALGLTAPRPPGRAGDSGIRHELAKVQARAAQLRVMLADGRWNP